MNDDGNGRTKLRRVLARRIAVVCLVLVGGAFASLTSVALGAASKSLTFRYDVGVNPGVLAKGTNVKAVAKIANPRPRYESWWGLKTVSTVVRKGVSGNGKKPFSSQGYRCTTAKRGTTTNFTCKRRRTGVSTSVKLTFAAQLPVGP
jgi:hypothetical protein